MAIRQKMDQAAMRQRDPITVDTSRTLTVHEMEMGTVRCTLSTGAQTVTLPDLDAPPFFIIAAGGQSVVVSGLYNASDSTGTNTITTTLAGLCHRIKNYGWFCISDVATIA